LSAPLTAPASAQPTPQVVIDSATANAAQTVLFVEGRNFGAQPDVLLGGVPLGGVVVNADGTRLTATIDGVAPGSYRLLVSTGRATPQNANFEVTLGAVGAEGPQGEPGPQGEQGEQGPPGADQSAAIVALTAQIDALSARIHTLESLLTDFSRTNGNLVIKANSISMISATSVDVDASTSVDIHADGTAKMSGSTTEISATGNMVIKGALVQIN
jgi:hypothetical protein